VRVGPELRVVAITGPNTGGKTVTLKSVGLAALMARAGLFLPCNGTPQLPWCSQVLADIGDEQSLHRPHPRGPAAGSGRRRTSQLL
jgi:DNA mismatch repair protein MutS2